jgi:hypothetical protein
MHAHTRYSVSSSTTNREREKKSSFYVCRWEIIGFVKRTTQTVEKEEVVENDESMKIRKMTEIVCLIFSTKENINDS